MVANCKIALITRSFGIILGLEIFLHLHNIVVYKIQIYKIYPLHNIVFRYLIILHECLEFSYNKCFDVLLSEL